MKLSKQFKTTLSRVLKKNTADVAKFLANLEADTKDEMGIPTNDYPFIKEVYGHGWLAVAAAYCVKLGKTNKGDISAMQKHMARIYEGGNSAIKRLKSLSVVVANDAVQQRFGDYIPKDGIILYAHSERGYWLEPSGSIGNYGLQDADVPNLRAATDEEIDSFIKGLNSAQQHTIITHQYFSEIRTAVLSE